VPQCLPGTRAELLQEILRLLRGAGTDIPHIVWLYGMAGTGKSTVASTVAHSLANSQNLGGTFFFSRNSMSNPDLVFSSLARELASRVPRLSTEILRALKRDAEIGSSAVSTQFSDLISIPLNNADGIYLPVIDALDECLAPSDLLSVIARWEPPQPPLLKFLITSRPEHDIRIVFDDLKSPARPPIVTEQ
jgi:Cdc6-like AAA superfamily ATPase